MNYTLYWIRNEEHTDPFTEGYIGVTKRGLNGRLREHRKRRTDLDLTHAKIESLREGSKEEISKLEKEYRPDSWIGWNKSKGGLHGGRPHGIHTSGWRHSEESKKARSEMLKGENNPMYGKTTSDLQKQRAAEGLSKALKGRKKWYKVTNPVMKGSDNPRARALEVDGVIYDTATEASEKLGINSQTIRYRCRSDSFPTYKYA